MSKRKKVQTILWYSYFFIWHCLHTAVHVVILTLKSLDGTNFVTIQMLQLPSGSVVLVLILNGLNVDLARILGSEKVLS